ncbi:TPA: hypothetical protein ACX3DQ_004550 [Vibrio parahaemolyticus]
MSKRKIVDRRGVCKLCKNEVNDLQDSHIIPKLLYRFMRRHQDSAKDINGLLSINSEIQKLDVTQRQWKKLIFCKSCEGILSKNETKFARILHDVNSMSLERRSKESFTTNIKGVPIPKGYSLVEIINAYKNNYFDYGVTEDLKYFAASYVLRQIYLIDHQLGDDEISMLEKYILGKGSGDFSLLVALNSGGSFKCVCSSIPVDMKKDFKHYNLILPEMWFHLIFDINKKWREHHVHILPNDFGRNNVLQFLLQSAIGDVVISEKAKKALQHKI